jgi:nucleoid-associated protein YgaU
VVVVVATLLVTAWAGPLARALGGPTGPDPVARTSYVARYGDTLWAIAERFAPGEDPRALVDAISAANAVDPGAIVPGQTLVIPSA